MGIVRALTGHEAETGPEAEDPRLRGRRYAVPFRQVWAAALEIAGGEPRWQVVETRPARGEIRAEARSLLRGGVDDVTVRVTLDEDGATRVDVRSASRRARSDLGANARRIDAFLRRLDQALARRG